METRRLGTAGPTLSLVGLGCNNFGIKLDAGAAAAVVHAALDAGITHFDTAEMYGAGKSEEFLGAALAGRRGEATIATKFLPRPADQPYTPGALAARIREACELSLRRLGTDHIDLFYQHYPDAEAPPEEALEALHLLVDAGKVRHVASSNIDAAQLAERDRLAAQPGRARFCGTQLEWNLLKRGVEAELVPAARAAGQGIVPYFPLASGMLTGKYRRDEPFPKGSRLTMWSRPERFVSDANFDAVERLVAVARERGHTLLELAMSWLAAQQGVASVIAGATTPEQVHANAAAVGWALSASDLAAVDEATPPPR